MHKQAWIYLLLLSLIWGASFAFIEIALTKTAPFTLVSLRVCCGALALWLWLRYLGQYLPMSRAFWGPVFIMGWARFCSEDHVGSWLILRRGVLSDVLEFS